MKILILLLTCFSLSSFACRFSELSANQKVTSHIFKTLKQLSSKEVTSVESISFIKPFKALVKYKHKVQIEDSELTKSKLEKELWTLSVNAKCKVFLMNISR